jgi:ketosteroid isomerase-like protein
MLVATTVGVRFKSEEIETFGDLAYERGTHVLTISDKVTGQTLQTATNRHVHVFKRQRSGEWKTWRMITNSATATPAAVQ